MAAANFNGQYIELNKQYITHIRKPVRSKNREFENLIFYTEDKNGKYHLMGNLKTEFEKNYIEGLTKSSEKHMVRLHRKIPFEKGMALLLNQRGEIFTRENGKSEKRFMTKLEKNLLPGIPILK